MIGEITAEFVLYVHLQDFYFCGVKQPLVRSAVQRALSARHVTTQAQSFPLISKSQRNAPRAWGYFTDHVTKRRHASSVLELRIGDREIIKGVSSGVQ